MFIVVGMFNDFLKNAVNAISERHSFNEKLASSIFHLKGKLSPNGFESIVLSVAKSKVSSSVAGVDSGFVSKKLSFLDLILVKTAGVIFEYKDGALAKTTYYPAPFSFPVPKILREGLEKDESDQSVSLVRLREEINCAIEIIKKYKPNFLFIDGSLVPQYQDKPRKESELNEDYHSIISLFECLYKTADENNSILVSCVEDSRGNRFRQILQESILPLYTKISPSVLNSAYDVALLDYYLRPNERTFAFPYTNAIENHPILKDYSKEWANCVFVFYIKSAEFDKPLRVEFISKDISKLKNLSSSIASVVFSLSSLHKEYSFPSILIEADLRAGLSEQEISVVYERLIDKLGNKIRLRRSNRPFG